jgi:hypothetical protein
MKVGRPIAEHITNQEELDNDLYLPQFKVWVDLINTTCTPKASIIILHLYFKTVYDQTQYVLMFLILIGKKHSWQLSQTCEINAVLKGLWWVSLVIMLLSLVSHTPVYVFVLEVYYCEAGYPSTSHSNTQPSSCPDIVWHQLTTDWLV